MQFIVFIRFAENKLIKRDIIRRFVITHAQSDLVGTILSQLHPQQKCRVYLVIPFSVFYGSVSMTFTIKVLTRLLVFHCPTRVVNHIQLTVI